MTVAIALLVIGYALVYSALKGLSLTEVFSGEKGDVLDPKGGNTRTFADGIGGGDFPIGGAAGNTDPGSSVDPKGQFKGPNAATLRYVATAARDRFHLTIGQVCRPKNATYGAPNSLHKECRAMDVLGSVSNRIAFARWAKQTFPAAEVFCDQAGMIAPGYEHTSHAHFGM